METTKKNEAALIELTALAVKQLQKKQLSESEEKIMVELLKQLNMSFKEALNQAQALLLRP